MKKVLAYLCLVLEIYLNLEFACRVDVCPPEEFLVKLSQIVELVCGIPETVC